MSWPADERAMSEAREFLRTHVKSRLALLPDRDVDGLTSGELVRRALERLGGRVLSVLQGKGENAFSPELRQRLHAVAPDALVLLDQGSREGTLLEGTPTLVVDHHVPRGFPSGALALTAFGHPPIAPSSLLTFELVRGLGAPGANDDLDWLAAMGTVADMGEAEDFPFLAPALARLGRTNVTEAIALLNAANRAAAHDLAAAERVLMAASSPRDIAKGLVPGVEQLRQYRAEVNAELKACSAAPRFAGKLALVLFRSPARIHPLIAQRWRSRLKGYVVLSANAGYLPNRVSFSMRGGSGEDLIQLLRAALPEGYAGEVAHGHALATGGTLPFDEFVALLERLGFETGGLQPAL